MKKMILWALVLVFSLTLALSGWTLYDYYRETAKTDALYDSLADLARQPQTAPTEQTDPSAKSPEQPTEPPQPDYSALKEKNADFAGWLTVPDTKINYPVLYRPQDQDYYLHRDFEGQEAAAGCLYIQENCDAEKPTDNVIIYGHNMKNGSMFGELEKYEDPSFWDTHRTFTFNTLNRFQTFEVVTVFKTVAYQEDAFRYYQFVEAEGEADFDAFLSQCQARALYDTGVEARFGDRLLTLSTCEYSRENGRLAVLARRIDP